ncbi:hypothetical protein PABG_11374, partial [Paracoccidioides brasiliensis Pb03]
MNIPGSSAIGPKTGSDDSHPPGTTKGNNPQRTDDGMKHLTPGLDDSHHTRAAGGNERDRETKLDLDHLIPTSDLPGGATDSLIMTSTITPPPYPYVPDIKTDDDHGRSILPTVIFTKGPPDPVCTGNCGLKCKAPFCREPSVETEKTANAWDYFCIKFGCFGLDCLDGICWGPTCVITMCGGLDCIPQRGGCSGVECRSSGCVGPDCDKVTGRCFGPKCSNCASGFCTGAECETGKDGYGGAQTARRCTELVTKIQLIDTPQHYSALGQHLVYQMHSRDATRIHFKPTTAEREMPRKTPSPPGEGPEVVKCFEKGSPAHRG